MIAGKTIINEEVFVELAKTAMSRIESIDNNTGNKTSLAGIAKLVANKVAPHINVKKADTENEEETALTVSFELKISILYGQNIPDVVNNVRDAVKEEVERLSGYTVDKIDVLVEKLVKPDATETESIE